MNDPRKGSALSSAPADDSPAPGAAPPSGADGQGSEQAGKYVTTPAQLGLGTPAGFDAETGCFRENLSAYAAPMAQAVLVGRLGSVDIAEYEGTTRVRLRVAVNRRGDTNWFTAIVWDEMGEECARVLKKGMRVKVVGALELWRPAGNEAYSAEQLRARDGAERLSIKATCVSFADGRDIRWG